MVETEKQGKVQAGEEEKSERLWEHEIREDTEIKQSEIIILIIKKII